MSRDEYRRRRAVLRCVLAHAEKNPAAGLSYEYVPEAKAIFRTRRELLLALQYDWSQALWARIEVHCSKAKSRQLTGASDLARMAWAECAAMYPVLRRLLDQHRDELGPGAQLVV